MTAGRVVVKGELQEDGTSGLLGPGDVLTTSCQGSPHALLTSSQPLNVQGTCSVNSMVSCCLRDLSLAILLDLTNHCKLDRELAMKSGCPLADKLWGDHGGDPQG